MSSDRTPNQSERRGTRHALQRRPRRRGEEREELRKALAAEYNDNSSIRALAAKHDLSYGLTRTLLLEAGTELLTRSRRAKTAVEQ